MEQQRAAENFSSFQDNALAKQYSLHYQGGALKLTPTILDQ
jgi:hypothetical protein